jgi:hypothetical protein
MSAEPGVPSLSESAFQALKRLLHFFDRSRAEVEHKNRGTVDKWMTPLVQVIPVTGQEDQPVSKGVGNLIAVAMTA